MTPEQVISHPSRDSGSDSESETWSIDRAINDVFRLLPPELCPWQTEEHAPAKPLSGIELLMESQSTPLMILPQSKLIENTTKFLQDRINSEKSGKEWVCPPNLVSALTQTKYYKSHSQFFPTDNIPQLLESEASLLALSNKGKCSILMRGWSGGAKVLCILHHWGVQLILAYSWARPAILVVGKGRGGMFLFLLFLHFLSCSSFFPVPLFHLLYSLFYLFSPFLWETTQNDPQGLTCR